MKDLRALYGDFDKPKHTVITMHQKPDGDAMGSTLGLYHFLLHCKHNVYVISPTNWAKNLDWLPGSSNAINYETETERSNQLIENADWIFCLDFNVLSRTKTMEPVLQAATGTKILIDHHPQPDVSQFDYGFSDTRYGSTAEMVYHVISEVGGKNAIDKSIAVCLYTGIMTDTGSFRYESANADTHVAVSHLKNTGIAHHTIHQNLYDNNSENKLRFLGNALLNRLQVDKANKAALIAIPHTDVIEYGIETGDTEGLVNYALSIEGVELGALLIDRGKERKWSFRSIGDMDVNQFARTYFNGGGHKNAAGGQTNLSFEEAQQLFKEAVRDKAELKTH